MKELPLREQASEIARRWRDADEATKSKYVQEAAKLKDEYEKKREEYIQSDEYKEFLKSQKENIVKEHKKEQKKRGPAKMSGYRLFLKENSKPTEEDLKDPELAGKGSSERVKAKWDRLNDDGKAEYNRRAAEMGVPEGAN